MFLFLPIKIYLQAACAPSSLGPLSCLAIRFRWKIPFTVMASEEEIVESYSSEEIVDQESDLEQENTESYMNYKEKKCPHENRTITGTVPNNCKIIDYYS